MCLIDWAKLENLALNGHEFWEKPNNRRKYLETQEGSEICL